MTGREPHRVSRRWTEVVGDRESRGPGDNAESTSRTTATALRIVKREGARIVRPGLSRFGRAPAQPPFVAAFFLAVFLAAFFRVVFFVAVFLAAFFVVAFFVVAFFVVAFWVVAFFVVVFFTAFFFVAFLAGGTGTTFLRERSRKGSSNFGLTRCPREISPRALHDYELSALRSTRLLKSAPTVNLTDLDAAIWMRSRV